MRRAVWFALVLSLAAPEAGRAAGTMFAVPEGATKVGHVVLQSGVAEEDHFLLTEKYPGSAAADHYSRILSSWRPCTAKQTQWTSFGDINDGKEQTVHELSRHWVNKANDTSVTLLLKYTSAGIKRGAVPDNDMQYVVVVRKKLKGASKEFSDLGLTCQKAHKST
jgi:hypothetical protein